MLNVPSGRRVARKTGRRSVTQPISGSPVASSCKLVRQEIHVVVAGEEIGAELAARNFGMIDKTARESQAIRDARHPFAEALTELGLMAHFHGRSAAEIDRLIEAAVTGYVDSMQRQCASPERTGTVPDDEIPF